LKKKRSIDNVEVEMNKKTSAKNREKLSQLPKEKLVEMIVTQQEVIEYLKEEIEKLKLSRDLNSKTSSKPPSSDLLFKSEKKKENSEKKRKPGGQPGHQGKTRKGFERVDRYEILRASCCCHCARDMALAKIRKTEKQQVAQLVPRPIEIVEYQRQILECPHCHKLANSEWSPEIIPGQDLGVRLQGLLGWLGNYGHLPYEKQQELLWELGKIKIGVGTLVETNRRMSGAINQSVTHLQNWINSSCPPLNIDETPWSIKGVKEWLWVFANPQFCLFRAGDTRGRIEIEEQLGAEYQGVIISDDFNVYNGYDVRSQQKCLAHLRRHLKKLIKTPGEHNQSIGFDLINIVDEAFKNHRNFRQTQNYQDYFGWGAKFKIKVEQTLTRWQQKAGYEAGKILRNLKFKADQWWYFLDHPEIPPDNNLAERALRLAVTKRKVSGGSRSMERFKDTASNLSAIQTCRFQGRSVVDFLADALKAHAGTGEQPSLIPDT
jgi:transposase